MIPSTLTRRTGLALALVASCTEPTPVTAREQADPGFLLGVSAPAYGTSTDWDLAAGRLIVGDEQVVAVNLATRETTVITARLTTVMPAVMYLRVRPETGTIFMTVPQLGGTNILYRVDRGGSVTELSQKASQGMGMSAGGRWLLFSEGVGQFVRLNVETGDRRVFEMPRQPASLLIDDMGKTTVFQTCETVNWTCTFSLLEIEEGVTRTGGVLPTNAFNPPQIVVFSGDTLVFLRTRRQGDRQEYYEWNSSTGAERMLGGIAVPIFEPSCVGWSPATHAAVVVVGVDAGTASTQRFGVFSLAGGASSRIRTADMFRPVACSLSPDGKWFVYGNSTGYITGPGRSYYLTAVP